MPDTHTKTVDTALKSMASDGDLLMRINGGCMRPLIEDGALVSIQKRRFYWPGDILVKRSPNGDLLAHRLIGFFPRRGRLVFISRADSASFADKPVPGSQIIGRVSGGECAESVISIPLRDRVKAIKQFTVLVARRLVHQTT